MKTANTLEYKKVNDYYIVYDKTKKRKSNALYNIIGTIYKDIKDEYVFANYFKRVSVTKQQLNDILLIFEREKL